MAIPVEQEPREIALRPAPTVIREPSTKTSEAAATGEEMQPLALTRPIKPEPVASSKAEAIVTTEPASASPPVVVEAWQAYEEFPSTASTAQSAEEETAVEAVAGLDIDDAPQARYQRLDRQGAPAAEGMPWSCVRDNRNHLVWEVKTREGGLRDAANVYSWFEPRQGGAAGVRDGGRCTGGIDCDTYAYRKAVNRLGLCGFSDWRLPAREELQTLVKVAANRNTPAIDVSYFPAAMASWYWSASGNAQRPDYAWYVLFRNGLPLNDLKERSKHVRLVRGERLMVASKH